MGWFCIGVFLRIRLFEAGYLRSGKAPGARKHAVGRAMWFNLAAAAGGKQAFAERNKIEQKMSTDAVLEAQRLAREWMAKHGK